MKATSEPHGFSTYWQSVLDELSPLLSGPVEIEDLPLRSNETSVAHTARFEGVDRYPLFAYFTLPRGKGPFPAVFQAPGYGSVVQVPAYERRSRYVVMALCHRGQRLSDSGYSAAYPGLLTDGLPDAASYRWRAIVADCLRALDVFTARPEVDAGRLAVVGNDLAAITAALRPETPFLLVNGMAFRDTAARARETQAYPLQELNDYARSHPSDAETVAATLSLFDPLAFAPRIMARTLVTCDRGERGYVEPVIAALAGAAELELRSGRSYLDHQLEEDWLARVLGA